MAATDASDETKTAGSLTAPFKAIATEAWWHRHLDPEERRRVMDELAITPTEGWAWRFTVMLTLAVVVAVMGLSANSAAVVIGAMLLAPLMTPVLGTAASLSMSLWPKAFWTLGKVVLATAWSIAVAFVLAMVLPNGPLADEVLARTRPDIRDLVVALAAGTAGAYATIRKDASSALPGVAVAVALVPPLATVGIALEASEIDLAVGGLLLYGTNLSAIIFAGVMVFIATGFVPPRRLANTGLQLLVAGVIALAVVAIVAVPLFNTSARAVEAVEQEVAAQAIVAEWLGSLDLSPVVDVDDDRVLVQLRGFDEPPDDADLTLALQRELGDKRVLVQWVRTFRATTTLPPVVTDEEAFVVKVQGIVTGWLAESDAGADYELERLLVTGSDVRIDVAGAGDPPSVDDLRDRFRTELQRELSVRLNWTPRETITPTSDLADPVEAVTLDLEQLVGRWAADRALIVESVVYDGERAEVSLIGPSEPLIYQLLDDIEELIGSGPRVEVLFTERRRITTTLPPIDVFPGLGPTGPTTTTTLPPTVTTAG